MLGKSGQRLKELETRTNTKISIPGIHDQSDKITVVGTRDSIEKALHEIKVISDEQVSSLSLRDFVLFFLILCLFFNIRVAYLVFIIYVFNEKKNC